MSPSLPTWYVLLSGRDGIGHVDLRAARRLYQAWCRDERLRHHSLALVEMDWATGQLHVLELRQTQVPEEAEPEDDEPVVDSGQVPG